MEASKSHPFRSKGSNTTTTTTTTTTTATLHRERDRVLDSRPPRSSDNSSSSPSAFGHRVSRSTSLTSSQPPHSFTQHGYYRPSNLSNKSSSSSPKQHNHASHLTTTTSRSSSNSNSNRGSEQTPQQHQLPTLKSRTTELLAFAASAFGKNSGAKPIASESKLRHRQSSASISISGSGQLEGVAATTNDGTNPFADPSPPLTNSTSNSDSRRPARLLRQSSTQSSSSLSNDASPGYHQEGRRSSQSLLQTDNPPSQPYSETDSSRPPPQLLHPLSIFENKMHQTSSRLLRMTDDDRPFTRDFKDLFATLIVSLLPLSAHRVRLTKVEHTFLSEDAINNLGSLKFSQSNRMPDPKDPSRIVTTTTTTTFSMAKDMARAICQRFLDARFIESADGRYQQVYTPKGSVWQITPKGISILDQFCSKNGIQQKQVGELIGNMVTQLVILERNGQTDKLVTDRGTIEVIFRRFVGTHGLNIKTSISAADSDSLNDYRDGITGVKMASERKVNGKTFKDTFTGKAACDWLMDCCSTVDRRETVEIANLFVEYDLIETIVQDRAYMSVHPLQTHFQPTKHAIYQLSSKGKELLNGSGGSRGRSSEGGDLTTTTSASSGANASRNAIARDSNTQRLDKILKDPALRLLFRENLRETHCEENLSFYLDVDEFVQSCRQAVRGAQKNSATNAMDGVKEIMAQAYGIYNAFLAPGSPCELNIDHQLRNSLATRMTKAVGQDKAMIDTLQEVTSLFEEAQNAVFKLMASDSVPKFLRSPKYEQTLRNYDFDSVLSGRGPERSLSRSNRK